jgi:GNAT superfamily N-acetyltransferase
MDQAFPRYFTPEHREKIIRTDPRLKKGPAGFCAVEDDQLVGFVGVMDIPTRTLDRTIELAGGIYSVATLPTHAKKGISTILMQQAHQYFKEQGYRFSFLNTSQIIVAYPYYQKLDYKVVAECKNAYKIFHKTRKNITVKDDKKKPDWKKILEIYNKYSTQKTGFVVRDKDFFNMLEERDQIQPKKTMITKTGYVLLKEEGEKTIIRELISTTNGSIKKLINNVEKRSKSIVCDRVIMDNNVFQAYKSSGFMVSNRSYRVTMVKPLKKTVSFQQMYGNEFFMSGADYF